MEASGLPRGYVSTFTSKQFPATAGRCFEFHYHMWGDHMGKLELFVLSSGGQKSLLWYKSGNKGQKWIRQIVNINSSTSYQIRFTSTAERGYMGDMALDNLFFTNVTCKGKLYINIF